jgi:fatty-acyl-CoA synthase
MPLSYSHGIAATPLLGLTIGDQLRSVVERFPEREALVVCSQRYRATYRQLWQSVEACARGLLHRGVKKGDRVGIWSPNRYEWVIVQYATARLGAILVNVNPAYQAPELEYVLEQAGISVLLHAAGFKQTNYLTLLETVRPRCPSLKQSLYLDTGWNALLAEGATVPVEKLHEVERTLHFDDPINIQYTSGTTGHPKGATLTHHNILNNAWFVGEVLGYTERDRVCVPVPFYHCFGMVLGNLATLARGGCVVAPGEAFAAKPTLEALAAERCTSLYGVPTMFRCLLEEPGFERYDVTSLRTGVMAGAPCPIELMREVIDKLHMPEVAIGYGMTETSPISTMSLRDDTLERRVSTVGKVHPHVEVCIVDPATNQLVECGTPGELRTRGYSVMPGYWNNPAATAACLDAAGWMKTGDLATMDAEGYVSIVGRLKDMIIRGGENIYPAEIEAVLHTHPDVSEAHIVGIPSEKYGEEVMAWLRLRPGATVEVAELLAYCQPRLSAYKIPKHWRFVEQFPMTVTGKVQKFQLREMGARAG